MDINAIERVLGEWGRESIECEQVVVVILRERSRRARTGRTIGLGKPAEFRV